jgi:hypothetical protein
MYFDVINKSDSKKKGGGAEKQHTTVDSTISLMAFEDFRILSHTVLIIKTHCCWIFHLPHYW